jgi:hypothetical protein
MLKLVVVKDAEREKLGQEMSLIIDELRSQIGNENMGASGQLKDNKFVGMLESLKSEMKLQIELISSL